MILLYDGSGTTKMKIFTIEMFKYQICFNRLISRDFLFASEIPLYSPHHEDLFVNNSSLLGDRWSTLSLLQPSGTHFASMRDSTNFERIFMPNQCL